MPPLVHIASSRRVMHEEHPDEEALVRVSAHKVPPVVLNLSGLASMRESAGAIGQQQSLLTRQELTGRSTSPPEGATPPKGFKRCGMWEGMLDGMWDVGEDVGCGMWDMGCGMCDVKGRMCDVRCGR